MSRRVREDVPVVPGHPSAVLDASAVLAWLQEEPGAQKVDAVIEHGFIGAANFSEVLQKAAQHGRDLREVGGLLLDVGLTVEDVTTDDAVSAALLWQRCPDLSLGDRLCLALGMRLHHPVVTADRSWRGRSLGIRVDVIR